MSWFKPNPPFNLKSLPPRLRELATDIWSAGYSGINILELGAREHLGVSSGIRSLRERGFNIETKRISVTDRRGNHRKRVTLFIMHSWPCLP